MRVLVIGAGIGGLTTAIALRRRGIDATVLERTPEPGPVGAGITLWPNATRPLRALGLGDAIAAAGAPALAGRVRSWRGDELVGIAVPNLEERYGAPGVALHRADLQRALLRAAGAATVRFGAEATAFVEDATGVTVRLADGREERGAAVVGADGLRSTVRTRLWGNEPPRYAGYTAWRGVVDFPGTDGATESWGAGQRVGLVPIGGGRLYWFATANAPEGGRDAADPRPGLLRRVGSWHDPIPQAITATAAAAILRNDVYDRDPRSPWGIGRVTLLGDAAHPMTPNLGQGACQAIEDAAVLATHLAGATDVPAALRAFEAARHARTRALVLRSRRLGWVGQWEWAPLVRVRDAALRRVPARAQLRQLDAILGYDAAAQEAMPLR